MMTSTGGEVFVFQFDEELKSNNESVAKKSEVVSPQQSQEDLSESQPVELRQTCTKPIDIPKKKKEFVPEYGTARP